MPRRVKLEWTEIRLALVAAGDRNLRALNRGRRETYGATPASAWQFHVVGMLGEMAVAKALGVYWQGGWPELDNGSGDVGSIQVRATTYPDGALMVYPRDRDEAAYVLVTGVAPILTLAGWIFGRDAKQERYWCTKRPASAGGGDMREPAYRVPQTELRDIDTLDGWR
jgi:hypothetical protein